MAKRVSDEGRPGENHNVFGARKTHDGPDQLYITAGGILTPVLGFKGKGVTGTPPAPQARGFTNEPGDGELPRGAGRKAGGSNALKAFGLRGTGENEK
jgi:hypothetical protein